MKKSVYTSFYVYSPSKENKSIETVYGLRVVGFTTDEDFAKMRKEPSLLQEIYTSETVNLLDIASVKDIYGMRIVGIIHSKDGVNTYDKKIFVSEKIDYISQVEVVNEEDSLLKVIMNGVDGSFMVAIEKPKADVRKNDTGFLAPSI